MWIVIQEDLIYRLHTLQDMLLERWEHTETFQKTR